jgi:hypothetical protein
LQIVKILEVVFHFLLQWEIVEFIQVLQEPEVIMQFESLFFFEEYEDIEVLDVDVMHVDVLTFALLEGELRLFEGWKEDDAFEEVDVVLGWVVVLVVGFVFLEMLLNLAGFVIEVLPDDIGCLLLL